MPRPYSGDLRRRVLAAALDGARSRDAVARALRGRPLDGVPLGRRRRGTRGGARPSGWAAARADDPGRERGGPAAAGGGATTT